MSQHDFVIDNQSFPATRTDLNAAILAVASNSSGATAPTTTYANQFWYETDTNTLHIRNEANDAWVSVITLDASMTATASELNKLDGVTATATELNKLAGLTSSTTELNQLDAITRGSILYGNASGATARLAKGASGTVLSSDGTDISWAEAGSGSVELISTTTISSDVSTVSITSGFDDSKYYAYEFRGSGFKINYSGGTQYPTLQYLVSADGGSSYKSSTEYYSAFVGGTMWAASSAIVGGGGSLGPGDYPFNWFLTAIDPLDANTFTIGQSLLSSNGNAHSLDPRVSQRAWGTRVREASNAFQFFIGASTGVVITAGSIALYGIKR